MTETADRTAAAGKPWLVLGLGCERGAPADEVIALASQALLGSQGALALIATLDNRRDEPAIRAAVSHFAVPLAAFDATGLEAETPRLATPSAIVFAHTGCHGVAEAAALAAVGSQGRLVVPKMKSPHATAAICESFHPLVTDSWHADSGSSDADSSRSPEVA